MESIRVLLGPMPAMHRDILDETFAAQDDIVVVGRSASADTLVADVAALAPHVTIVGADSAEWSDEHLPLLDVQPPRHLLLLANDARSASLFELRIHRATLADLSPRAILKAVRQAPRERATVSSGSGSSRCRRRERVLTMASLRDDLSVKLDVSSLVQGFVASAGGSVASLQGIADPTSPAQLGAISDGLDGVQLDGLDATLARVLERATALIGTLPVAGEVVHPVTDALETLESLVANPAIGDLETKVATLVRDLGGVLDTPNDQGILGALHTVALALGSAPEGQLALSLARSASGLTLPDFPLTDAIVALDGAVRVVGGLMVLDSVTGDIDRLVQLMARRLDTDALDRELEALGELLTLDGVELADAMAAADAGNLPQLQRIADAVAAIAATLGRLRDEYSAAMGMGEATLVYLDIDALSAELDTGRTLIRTGDLAPLTALAGRAAGALQPVLRQDLLAGPTHTLDALLTDLESRLATIAGGIASLDVEALTRPLDEGLHVVTAPIDALAGLLDDVRVAYQGALRTLQDGVTALPLRDVANAIHALLAPIAEVLAVINQVVGDVLAALQGAADATTATLGEVESLVDGLKQELDQVFGVVRDFLKTVNLDQALGAVAENIAALATALEQARMEPYFDSAAGAIDAAASVIDAVPFDLLPESMKADVDAAVAPIKDADASALETELLQLLQIDDEGHFTILQEMDAAIASLSQSFQSLLDEVRAHEPRAALADVDATLATLAQRVQELSPALTLQPIQDAIAQVQEAIGSLDVASPLAPVQGAFDQVTAAIDSFTPSTLLGGIEDRITTVREQVTSLLRLDEGEALLDDAHAQATTLLDRYDADQLQRRLQAAIDEFVALADRTPGLRLTSGFGAIVSGLLGGMGLRTYPHSFDAVLDWMAGALPSETLNARVAGAGTTITTLSERVAALSFQAQVGTLSARIERVRTAIAPLSMQLAPGLPARAVLAASAPRLDASATFGFLEGNRARFATSLASAATRIQVIAQAGFTDADTRVANLVASLAPLDPARSWVRQLLERMGVPGLELGVAGALRAIFLAVPAERLIGLVRPIFDALRGRVEALVNGILGPLKDGVARVRAALDAIDLAPLLASLDAIHAEVLAQVQAFSPDALLGDVLDEVTALQATLAGADPLAPVIGILDAVRDTIARVLGKLSVEALLEIPLEVYDELLAELSRLDVAALIAPLRAQLDEIARQVHDGLDETVVAFERLQDALPSGGGGSSASASVSVA